MTEETCLALISKTASHFYPELYRDLSAAFSQAGKKLSFHYIEDDLGIAQEIDRAAGNGCRSFLAAGGDGTVSLVAGHLFGKPHSLGIIPTGTANTLARVLRIPMNINRAIRLAAVSQKTRAIDGMEVNGRLCFLNVSTGVSSFAVDNLNPKYKARTGIFSYVIGVAQATHKITPCDYELLIDGHPYSIRAVEIHVTNTGVLGVPQYHVHESSRIDDGSVEIVALSQWTPQEIADAALDIALRRKKRVIKFIGEGREIRINSTQNLAVQGDGDIIGKTPVDITVRPRVINFIVR
ncbi:transcription regulator [Dehalogenimonas sp. WBC-2]|nr:transcription regulator [Dehalogenimonas sp. WBC-2]